MGFSLNQVLKLGVLPRNIQLNHPSNPNTVEVRVSVLPDVTGVLEQVRGNKLQLRTQRVTPRVEQSLLSETTYHFRVDWNLRINSLTYLVQLEVFPNGQDRIDLTVLQDNTLDVRDFDTSLGKLLGLAFHVSFIWRQPRVVHPVTPATFIAHSLSSFGSNFRSPAKC
ncbi:hypothetical protein D3C84_849590 [compost metagenome]